MIYKQLFQLQKTLAIALSLVGTYGSLSLPTLASVKPQAALSTVPTATPRRETNPSFFSLQVAQKQGGLASRSGLEAISPPVGSILAQNAPSPPPPKDRGAPAPGQRVGGGSRSSASSCPVASKRLTALVPIISATPDKSQHPVLASTPAGSVLGLTVASHPTFWFYYPYSLTSEYPVEFVLKDDKGTEIYKTALSESANTPGVVGFKLPDNLPPLEVNKRYEWYFSISCARSESTSNEPQETVRIVVHGWVERVTLDPSLQSELAQATPQQKALLYDQAGIWYEAVTTLAELRRQNPNDAALKEDWDKLLRSIDLEQIAPEPITSMLTPKK